MEYVAICLAALAGSALTFFSGFGLGTILLPVFALFFPVEIAIALTAVVHFLNNIFKILLVGRAIDTGVAIRFGIPSLLASFAGALVLTSLTGLESIYSYELGDRIFHITPVKLTIALVLFVFVLFDLLPRLSSIQFDARHMVLGGLLSGFFGGLSGTQGALRTAFLIRSGLTKEAFIATGVAIACLVDMARLAVYSGNIAESVSAAEAPVVIAATAAAFAGAFAGSRILRKVTMRTVQVIVAVLLLAFSLLLAAGLI